MNYCTVLQEMMILDSQVRWPRAKSEGETPLQSASPDSSPSKLKNHHPAPRLGHHSQIEEAIQIVHWGLNKTCWNVENTEHGYHITLYETVVHRRLSSIFPSSEWTRCDQHRVYSSESHPYRKSMDFECPTSFKTVQMCVTFQAWSVCWRIKWILNVLRETMLVGGFTVSPPKKMEVYLTRGSS